METSLLKTLAGKHRSTVGKMAGKYKAVIATPAGPRKGLQVVIERDRGRKPLVARFGGYPCGGCAQPPSPTSGPSSPAPSGTS